MTAHMHQDGWDAERAYAEMKQHGFENGVVDDNDGKLLGEVPGINGAHGVALVEHTGQ